MLYEPSVPAGHSAALVDTQNTGHDPKGGTEGLVLVLTVTDGGEHAKGSVPVSQNENVHADAGTNGLCSARAVASLLRSMAEAPYEVN